MPIQMMMKTIALLNATGGAFATVRRGHSPSGYSSSSSSSEPLESPRSDTSTDTRSTKGLSHAYFSHPPPKGGPGGNEMCFLGPEKDSPFVEALAKELSQGGNKLYYKDQSAKQQLGITNTYASHYSTFPKAVKAQDVDGSISHFTLHYEVVAKNPVDGVQEAPVHKEMYMFDGAQCGPEFARIGYVFARGANCRLMRECHVDVPGSSFILKKPNGKSKKFMSKTEEEEKPKPEKPKCEEYFGNAHSHSNVGPKLQSMAQMEPGLANGLRMLKQFLQQTQLLHQFSNVDCEELEGTLQISTDMNQRRTKLGKPSLPSDDEMSVDDETPVAFVERLKGENVYKFTTKDYDFTPSAEMEKAIKDVLDAFEATASVADAPATMDEMVQALAEDEAVRQELAKVAPGSRTWPSWTLRAAVTSLAAEDILPRVNELQEVATKLCRRDYPELQALVADARKHLAEMSSLKERIKSSGREKPSVAEKAYATNQRDTFCEKHGLDSEQYKKLGTLVRAN